ncbi:hypothetical protein QBC46DRAFT_397797 [Diplogelasinospora grovesii]|uniref:CFEM domain-containing protein n=1 Tax=Diplogelasinospora grovesii TaxID=303347 RepID=A0AAN6MYL3_9PEZI|nr:hypothetical protein QBC46DRAFT_397797 [Diplogelasinospora grovesii]
MKVPCLTSAASAIGCQPTDYACQCSSSAQLQSSAINCVLSNCGIATGEIFAHRQSRHSTTT